MVLIIVKINDLQEGIICIYKINYPNGKIYIGKTINLKRRMYEHNNINKAKQPCDKAIVKYGKVTEIEILEMIEDPTMLDEREVYYIKTYNSTDRRVGYNLTDGGQSGTRRGLTKEQVLDIRTRWRNGESLKSIRDLYKDIISSDTINRVIDWKSYCDIGIELKCDRVMTREEKISENAKSRSVLSNEDKEFIINLYKNGMSKMDIYRKHFADKCSWQTVMRVCQTVDKE